MCNGLFRALRAPVASLPLFAAIACGGGAWRLQDITPESVPALQAQHAQQPSDLVTMTRLGVGYFRANRLTEARAVFDSVVAMDPSNGLASIYLGMTAESQGDFSAASGAYGRYVQVTRGGQLRDVARRRLSLVGRRELEFGARQALAREAELTATEPEPNTIAVMPFAYTGANQEVAPLTRGFAQLLVTDLARSRQVRVLERERVQALMDELRLGEEQRADPQTAARSGRLLRAARVVQGSLTDSEQQLRVDAAVVDVTTSGTFATRPWQDQLDRLFDIEKAVVFDIFDRLGIQLSDAERAAIEQRPTQNLQAFLAWSRGLEAEDRGDFTGARDYFGQAVRLDPGFRVAGASVQQAQDLSAAAAQTVRDVDLAVQSAPTTETPQDTRQQSLQASTDGVAPPSVAQVEPQAPPPTIDRPQSDPVTPPRITPTSGTVIIVIRRP